MQIARTITMAFLAATIASGGALFAASANFVYVTTTDFVTGSSSTLNEAKSATLNVASIHSDATARFFDNLIYVVNRVPADNIQVLDPCNSYATSIQFTTGNGSNPHDILCTSPTKCYVTRYDTDELWEMDQTTGNHTGTVSFASLADADGIPEMDQMFLWGSKLFVSVQRLDRNNLYSPVGSSYVAVVDINTNTFVDADTATGIQHILLPATNPFSEIQYDGTTSTIYLSCVGFFGVNDGGVVRINPVTLQVEGFMITEAAAGGDILDVEVVRPDTAFAIISTASFVTDLISFNPQTGTKYTTVYSPGARVLQDIDLSPWDDLMLTDRTAINPGIRCYDPSTGIEITTGPISTDLPPFDLTFGGPIVTNVRETPQLMSLGQNYPNPFNPATTIPYSLAKDTFIHLGVYDVTGTLVRTLKRGVESAGDHEARWDGTDDSGAVIASGVYFARLRAEANIQVRKIVMLK